MEERNEVSILDSEIYSKRKVIEKSQPMVFSILQNLVNAGLNEHDILMVFKIFKTDLCNNIPYDDRTYLERLSKDLNKYPTVRDTLQGLNNNGDFIKKWGSNGKQNGGEFIKPHRIVVDSKK